MPITDEQMVGWLASLGFAPQLGSGEIRCTVPGHRLDIEREIDLIEEVSRMMGHDTLPVNETIEIRVTPAQPAELARHAINEVLVGIGFVETVTHGLIDARDAEPFIPPGSALLGLEASAPATVGHTQAGSVLRPSLLPSLLRVLAHNHDNGVRRLRLFESAATFLKTPTSHDERKKLALVMDATEADSLRSLRGVIDRLVETLLGPGASVEVVPDDGAAWCTPGGLVRVNGKTIGRLGLLSPGISKSFELDDIVAVAEIELGDLATVFPPDTEARSLPSFPAVERDISAIVTEDTTWAALDGVIVEMRLEHLEAVEYVSTFRGPPIDGGRKSVTMRLRFRAPDRTLVHESVDVQVDSVVSALETDVGAEIRR
jgi:phenylalanyl-tRNA synthetase beta chain